jgi:C_GCAxxG_C_C family probable redox protein
MTPEDMALKAQRLFLEGFHCSQAVFAVGAEKLNREAKDVIAALAPFGGGMGSTGAVCGSLPGALAALGLTMGRTEPGSRDGKAMWRYSQRMVTSFIDITLPYGGPNCHDIARVDWKDRGQVMAFHKDPDSRRMECLKVIGETAKILGELLDQIGERK